MMFAHCGKIKLHFEFQFISLRLTGFEYEISNVITQKIFGFQQTVTKYTLRQNVDLSKKKQVFHFRANLKWMSDMFETKLNIQFCRYSVLQVFSSAGIRFFRYSILQVFDSAGIQFCRYSFSAGIRVCRHSSQKVFNSAGIQFCRYSRLQGFR